MKAPGPDDVLYAFGSFVADPAMGVLRRNGLPINLTAKSFDVLITLIERRGELVEKDLLLKLVWPNTIVEENNLARHISTLRKILDDQPSLHQYIVTIQGSGYRFVAPVQEFTRATLPPTLAAPPPPPVAPSGSPSAVEPPARRTSAATYLRSHVLALAALVVATVAAASFVLPDFTKAKSEAPERNLWQLTSSGGLESEAAWAPDGRTIAYSSDHAGNVDIWAQPVGEGNPVRLTSSPAQDSQPSWSRDGRFVAYRSENDGGGIFVVPATGGAERRITKFGYTPLWSPKDSRILFTSTTSASRSKLYVVDPDSGQVTRVLENFLQDFSSFRADWHPDGGRISVYGTHNRDGLSFWTVALNGTAPVRSAIAPDVTKRLKKAGVSLTDFRWAPAGDALYFVGRADEAVNIWQVRVDPRSLEWREGPERLTVGAGLDTNIAVSPDGHKLAFTIRNEHTRLWSLPFDPTEGRVLGKGQPITVTGTDALYPDVARNGRELVYRTTHRGKQELWIRSLVDGRDRLLTSAEDVSAPRWSDDGRMLAFRRRHSPAAGTSPLQNEIVLMAADGSQERLLTSTGPRRFVPYGWSPDGSQVVASCEHGPAKLVSICLLPLSAAPNAQDKSRIVASDPERNLYQPVFSPNQRWIAFDAVSRDVGVSTIYVVAVDGGQWTPISDGAFWDDKPRWSPDGRTLYFVSNRSGFLNVWGRRFDQALGKPSGDPFRVTNFETPSERVSSPLSTMELALTANQIILPVVEASGAVWILENVDR